MIYQQLPRTRKGISPIISTIIILAVTLVSVMTLGVFYNSIVSSNREYTTLLVLSSMSSVTNEVENAKWKVLLLLKNTGTGDIIIEKMSVSTILVTKYSISSTEKVPSTLQIGTSIPESGLKISPGQTSTVLIWIGSELFSSGTTVTIELLNIGSTAIPISVTLV